MMFRMRGQRTSRRLLSTFRKSAPERGGARLLRPDERSWQSKPVGRERWVPLRAQSPLRLHLTVSGNLEAQARPRFLFRRQKPPASLPRLQSALERAATDPDVESILLEIKPLGRCLFARVEELAGSIRAVAAKKRVVGFVSVGSERELALAAACTEAYGPADGYLELKGFSLSHRLMKGLAEKAGVLPEVSQRGRFKGGHSLEAPWQDGKGVPDVVRERTAAVRDSLRANYVRAVAQDLPGMSENDVCLALEQGPAGTEELVSAGILSGVRTRDDAFLISSAGQEGDVQTKTDSAKVKDNNTASSEGVKPEATGKVGATNARKTANGMVGSGKESIWTLESYEKYGTKRSKLGLEPARTFADRVMRRPQAPGIAVINVAGTIRDGRGSRPQTVYSENTVEGLQAVADRKDVDAVVLRIDSPGGSALASSEIFHAASILGRTKPVVASMGDVAASGGYYIGMAAERVFAMPSTVTGSIGVITVRFSFGELLRRLQIWVETDPGRDQFSATASSFHRGLLEHERVRIEGTVERLYQDFVGKAAACRGMTVGQMGELAEGRVWTGAEAVGNGLVDEIGGVQDAVAHAASLIGKSAEECRVFTAPLGKRPWWTQYTGGIGAQMLLEEDRAGTAVECLARAFPDELPLMEMAVEGRPLAILPFALGSVHL